MLCYQCDRANRVVVARDGVVDLCRVTVGVDDRNDRDTKPLCLGNSDVFFFNINDEQNLWQFCHLFDAAEELVQSFDLGCEHQ